MHCICLSMSFPSSLFLFLPFIPPSLSIPLYLSFSRLCSLISYYRLWMLSFICFFKYLISCMINIWFNYSIFVYVLINDSTMHANYCMWSSVICQKTKLKAKTIVLTMNTLKIINIIFYLCWNRQATNLHVEINQLYI